MRRFDQDRDVAEHEWLGWFGDRRGIGDEIDHDRIGASADIELCKQEFFRRRGLYREAIRGKKWLLLTKHRSLRCRKRRELMELAAHEPPSVQGLPAQGAVRARVDLYD
jgi:hypothetical protein